MTGWRWGRGRMMFDAFRAFVTEGKKVESILEAKVHGVNTSLCPAKLVIERRTC